MKGITAALGCAVLLQVIGLVPAKPQILMDSKTMKSLIPDSNNGLGDVQIEPPQEEEVTDEIDLQMLVIARALQKGIAEDHFFHLRSVSDQPEEDRDGLYHPSFEGVREARAVKAELVYSQAAHEPEEDRDALHHS